VGLIDSPKERSNRFPTSQESERQSLYTRMVELIHKKHCEEAEQLLDEVLLSNPDSGEAILCWTELKLYQRDDRAVIDRVLPLNATSPRNPYYMLATTLFEIEGSDVESLDYPWAYDGCSGELEYWANEWAAGSSDPFAKLAFASIIRGMWPSGMYYFIEAIKAKENNSSGPADLILLWEKNELSLELYLLSVQELQGRRLFQQSFNDVSLKMIVQTLFILLLAYEDLGICEARTVALWLANGRQQIAEVWENLTPLFRTFCGDWLHTQVTDDAEPVVRTRVGGLIASQLIC
jgi:hypothetical protein